MGVRLKCLKCGTGWLSALRYRGRGEHLCKHCGGHLALADAADDRRSGHDRRRTDAWAGTDWRKGFDRREAPAV
jgi:hypothetical protein